MKHSKLAAFSILRATLVVTALLLIAACQASPQLQPTLAPTSVTDMPQPVTVTDTPQLAATPAVSDADGWRELLSYVSPEWLNIRNSQSPLGAEMYLADVAQLRADLNLPPITGADDRKAKLPLIAKLSAVGYMAVESGYFKQWGWDIADVRQIVNLWDDYTWLYRGDFSRPEIKQRLLDQGYAESQLGEFAIFTKDAPRTDQYAWKPDTIIISRDKSILRSLIRRKIEGREGLDQQPVMAQMLKQLEGTWGALLATAGSTGMAQRSLETSGHIDPEFEKVLKEKWPEMLTSDFEFGWDALGIGWQGARPKVGFTILYHYPSITEAEKDVPLLKRTLTDNPSFSSRGRLWLDVLDLQTVETDGEILIAHASGKTDNVFGSAIANYDFTFLPVRTIPRAVRPTPTLAAPIKAITSTYGSNWTLYTNERDGFALALPPKWAQITLDPDLIETMLLTWQEQNPELPKELGDQARHAAASGVKFMGFDVSPAGRKTSFQVGADVRKADLPRGMSLDSVVSQAIKQFDKLTTVVKPVQHQRVQLKAGEAERFQMAQQLILPSGQEVNVEVIQYVWVRDDTLYVLSLEAPTEYLKDYTETFEEIADSFQFVR